MMWNKMNCETETMKMPRVNSGDTVAVVAPASAPAMERLEPGLAVIERWGLVPKLFGIGGPGDGYLSSPDDVRLRNLQDAIDDDEARVLWAARGGYGTGRIAAQLEFPKRDPPPLLVGFSDISLLLARASQMAGWPAVHGPNITTLSSVDEESVGSLGTLLFEGRPPRYAGLDPVNSGRAGGRLLPMNLSILASVIGTPLEPGLAGTILVLEDTNELPYKVDRLLIQVARCRSFPGVAGLVFGDLEGALKERRLRRSIEILAHEFGLPCATGFPIGHRSRNLPVPVGAPAVLDADAGTVLCRGCFGPGFPA